ncbi:MAG: adenosylcobinamide-GDP ribazoletransferase [Acidobacteria bacterium]|nr:adenosylcobinamide-GDP ribazoletransferase [Acidobacteriota bacterium]
MHVFWTAVMFFTRIPVPASLPYSNQLLNQALRFFPLVGMLVGILGAGVLWLALLVFPPPLALLVSMGATILITGAFHEDGFADFCDGYGGGMSAERILEIMKDSRLGTYGTIGLLAMLAAKYTALVSLTPPALYPILVAAHTLSRFVPVLLVRTTRYIREDSLSKSKPIGNEVSTRSLLIAACCTVPPLIFLPWRLTAAMLAVSAVILVLFRRYILKRTGGYSGDVLGALQQLCELGLYLAAVALHHRAWPCN